MGDGAGSEREDTSERRAEWRETRWGSSCNQHQRETCDVYIRGNVLGYDVLYIHEYRSIGEMYGVYIYMYFFLVHFSKIQCVNNCVYSNTSRMLTIVGERERSN